MRKEVDVTPFNIGTQRTILKSNTSIERCPISWIQNRLYDVHKLKQTEEINRAHYRTFRFLW